MVLASSGPISFSEIRTEMGGSGAVSLGNYRANGTTGARGVTGVPASGTVSFNNFRGKTAIPVTSGLIAKYSGESWNGSALVDETGGTYNTTSTGTIVQTAGILANSRKYIYGSTSTSLTFPVDILPSTYTLFHLLRFNGVNRQRIIDGSGTNWMSGTWQGRSGLSFHGGVWITENTINHHYDTWVLSTDQLSYYASNQINRTTGTATTSTRLTINNGAASGSSKSDWALATVLVYNTELSASQILQVENYLRNMYDTPTVSYYSWYSDFSRYNSGYTMVQTSSDPDVQIQMNNASVFSGNTGLYKNTPTLQNFNQVVIDFEIYIANASADGMSFYMGGTAIGVAEYGPANSYSVGFQIYNGVKTPGIYLYKDTMTITSNTSVSLNVGAWRAVKIVYNKNTSNTWQVFYNGSSVISVSDGDHASWMSSAGVYWGFGCRVGAYSGDYFVRRVSVSYQL